MTCSDFYTYDIKTKAIKICEKVKKNIIFQLAKYHLFNFRNNVNLKCIGCCKINVTYIVYYTVYKLNIVYLLLLFFHTCHMPTLCSK